VPALRVPQDQVLLLTSDGLFPGPTPGYAAVVAWSRRIHGPDSSRHQWALAAAAAMDETGPGAVLPAFPSRLRGTAQLREETARRLYRNAAAAAQGPPLLAAGSRHQITLRAGHVNVPGKGPVPEKFMPGCFDSQVGEVVPMTFRDTEDGPARAQLGMAKVISAVVSDDGLAVFLTYEVVSAAGETITDGG
jgi:hypothetical protein